MAFPSKLQMPVAAHERSQHDLSAPHVTTSNFMELNVSKCIEMVPDQSLDITHDLFSRLEPLPVPTFGLAEIRNKAFFVPLRTLWPAFTDFDNDTIHIFDDGVAIPSNVPLITNDVLFEFLSSDDCAIQVGFDEAYSFSYYNEGGTTRLYAQFTGFGRYCYKILRSLGYAPIMYRGWEKTESALPIMGIAKVYLDWFFPAQYGTSGFYAHVAGLLSRNTMPSSTESYLTSEDLLYIFQMLRFVAYDPDYFTSAWDNPVGPNLGLSSTVSITDITTSNTFDSVVSNDSSEGTPYISENPGDVVPSPVSQYSLDALKSMTDYMKRNQLVGSRSLDRHLARYGYKLAAEKLNRSILINDYRQQIQFGDVTSTASTDGATLGDYAGKGVSYGEKSYIADSGGEFGYLFIITTIMPKTHYYQGTNRQVKHITRTDFWKPEYDALGVQAISQDEFYSPLTMPIQSSDRPDPDNVFGFTSRYAEYKVPYALITGDYVDSAINVGKDAWTLFRDVSKANSLFHNFNIVTGADSDQYLRIFNNTNNDVDHFNIIHNFRIMSSFPGKSLFDTYEFKDEDKSKKVSMDVGGTTVS